jgi:hypothetical protein
MRSKIIFLVRHLVRLRVVTFQQYPNFIENTGKTFQLAAKND